MSRWTKHTTLDGDPAIEVQGRNIAYFDGLYSVLKKLAHYEDLEEQGRLIELPCKVGSRVYFVVSSGEIWNITLDDLNTVFEFKDLIGKVYFLTKEEAEAKLKEMKGSEDDGESL